MATSADIKRFQMIHKLPQTGIMNSTLSQAIARYQRDFGLSQTGMIDGATLAKYKIKWPYAWASSSPVQDGTVQGRPANYSGQPLEFGGSSGASASWGEPTDFSQPLSLVVNGVILYGIFRVLIKVF